MMTAGVAAFFRSRTGFAAAVAVRGMTAAKMSAAKTAMASAASMLGVRRQRKTHHER